MYQNCNVTKNEQKGHPSQYPQGYFKDKPCRRCDEVFSPKTPAELYCSDGCKDEACSEKYLIRTYGIDLEKYKDLHKYKECEICGSEGFILNQNSIMKLCVDHDHKTKQVRGVLCHNCNRALGLFQDSLQFLKQAIIYLERATTIPKGSTQKSAEARDSEN